jgi:ribosome biogenesis protein Nip4
MNQSFPCRYGSILQEKNYYSFGSFFGVFVATRTTRKKQLRQHNFLTRKKSLRQHNFFFKIW